MQYHFLVRYICRTCDKEIETMSRLEKALVPTRILFKKVAIIQ